MEWNVSSYTSFLYCTHYYLIRIPFFFLFIEIIVRLVDLFVPFFSFNHWYCVECSNTIFVYIFNLYSSFKRFISWILFYFVFKMFHFLNLILLFLPNVWFLEINLTLSWKRVSMYFWINLILLSLSKFGFVPLYF